MSLFPKIIRSSNLINPKQWLVDYFGGSEETLAGTTIDQHSSLAISAVYSCVTCISSAVASLPLHVYKTRKSGGRDRATNHPIYDLLHIKPNDEMTSFSMRESQMAHILLWGNKFSFVENDILGRVKSLYPLTPDRVSVERNDESRIVYNVTNINGKLRKYNSSKILHTPGFSYNGLFGQSVVSQQREKLGISSALDQYEARFFGSGTHPSVVVSLPPEAKMSGPLQEEYKIALKKEYEGVKNAKKAMVLFNGEDVKTLSMPMHDAQFIELYKAKAIDICGWFKVPPHMIGILDNATFSNIEHQAIQFAVHCIRPWLVRDEQSINAKLFTNKERKEGYFVENTIDGLLRGDVKARSEFYQSMFNIGAMSPNDVRKKENANPYKGGEKYFVPLNMIDQTEVKKDDPDAKKKPSPGRDPESKESKAYQGFKATRTTTDNSIIFRDKIAQQYAPLILKSAQNIIDYESNSITQYLENRSIKNWLDDFYRKFPEYIMDEIGPVFNSFSIAIREAAEADAGAESGDVDIEKFVSEYIETYASRHSKSSFNQLKDMIEADIEGRVTEWREKRPDKIAKNETSRLSNAVYQFSGFSLGFRVVWAIRGAQTCPYCQTLNGKTISRGGYFVAKGEDIKPNGEKPMRSYGTKRHPPLHAGCDCFVRLTT